MLRLNPSLPLAASCRLPRHPVRSPHQLCSFEMRLNIWHTRLRCSACQGSKPEDEQRASLNCFIVCNKHNQDGLLSPAHSVVNPPLCVGGLLMPQIDTLHLIDKGSDIVSGRRRGILGSGTFETRLFSWKTGGKEDPRAGAAGEATGAQGYVSFH